MRYRQHKQNGTIIQADWLTNFSLARLGPRSFFKLAKSRWEIENQGFNDGKNLFGMEHIQHHHPNSMLVNWLFVLPALIIERLYRIRYLHRGTHPVLTSMHLKDTLWLHLRPAGADTSRPPQRPSQGAAPLFDNPTVKTAAQRAPPYPAVSVFPPWAAHFPARGSVVRNPVVSFEEFPKLLEISRVS